MLGILSAAAILGKESISAVRSRAPGGSPTRITPDWLSGSISELVDLFGARHGVLSLAPRHGTGEPGTSSRFAFTRVRVAENWNDEPCEASRSGQSRPREEWLIAESPDDHEQPIGYWISNLAADTPLERLARLARLGRTADLDYERLRGGLGLDHYEGRAWLGWHHHTALVTAAHGFLTLERLNGFARS